jgi:DNA polymerase III delta prime subunit
MMEQYIWYEKHRPKSIDEMVLPEDSSIVFKNFINDGEIPHLLLHGPKGSGKTTIARILIAECGAKSLTLNASSNDRGIETIKTKVKQFASNLVTGGKKNIIFMDEADGLTIDAQFALKNTIEAYHKTCRFIFTANHPQKVIEEIHSRCMVFAFGELKKNTITRMVIKILRSEVVKFNRKDVAKVVGEFHPDIRTIINRLQAGSSTGALVLANCRSFSVGQMETSQLLTYIFEGALLAIRGMWKGVNDFTWLFKWLYEDFINEVDKDKISDVLLTIAEYAYRDRFIIMKEINATACVVEIMVTLGIEVNNDIPF